MGTAVVGSVGRVVIACDGQAGMYTKIRETLPGYIGDTAITPTEEKQILHTANKSVYSDIVINPIPSDYGKITWDGITLTVS